MLKDLRVLNNYRKKEMKRKLYFVIVGLLGLMSCNDVEMVEGQLSKSKVKAI